MRWAPGAQTLGLPLPTCVAGVRQWWGRVRLLRPGDAVSLHPAPDLPGCAASHTDLGNNPGWARVGRPLFLFEMRHSLSWLEVRCFPALVSMPRSCLFAQGQVLFWLWEPSLRDHGLLEGDLNEKETASLIAYCTGNRGRGFCLVRDWMEPALRKGHFRWKPENQMARISSRQRGPWWGTGKEAAAK